MPLYQEDYKCQCWCSDRQERISGKCSSTCTCTRALYAADYVYRSSLNRSYTQAGEPPEGACAPAQQVLLLVLLLLLCTAPTSSTTPLIADDSWVGRHMMTAQGREVYIRPWLVGSEDESVKCVCNWSQTRHHQSFLPRCSAAVAAPARRPPLLLLLLLPPPLPLLLIWRSAPQFSFSSRVRGTAGQCMHMPVALAQ